MTGEGHDNREPPAQLADTPSVSELGRRESAAELPLNFTLAEINRRNVEFWVRQQELLLQRIRHPALVEDCIRRIGGEIVRNTPIRYQMTFESAIEEAEASQQRFVTFKARSAARATRRDPLQKLLEGIVTENPEVSEKLVLRMLQASPRPDPVVQVDDQVIAFGLPRGHIKRAKISGLKDRLARARATVSR